MIIARLYACDGFTPRSVKTKSHEGRCRLDAQHRVLAV